MANEQHGAEVARYLNMRGMLCSVREDGVTLVQSITFRSWKVGYRAKQGVDLHDWRAAKLSAIAKLEPWRLKVKKLPSMRQLEEWSSDGVCGTPTGHTVEPDGVGPDGVPSWLLALGLI